MEKYLLEDFQNELSQIKEYIKLIQQVNDLVAIEIPNELIFQQFKTHFHSFERDKKTFEYKAIIISLYGLLEKHIELWIHAYLTRLSNFIAYNKLSDSFNNKHFELSMKLINAVIEGRHAKYTRLNKEDILKKLNTCIENTQSYNFNVEAFTMQSGNLTHSRIEEIFKTIDITNLKNELLKNPQLVTLIGISSPQLSNTESSVLFAKINELVERRNTIAHGAKIDDLLDISALEPYIEFLEKYCTALFNVLEEKDTENHTMEKYQEVSCQGVFLHKTVIGLSIENYTIKVGDWIIIKTAELGNEHFYKKKITSLGKEGKNHYKELKIEEASNVSVGIYNLESLPITNQCAFYLEKK